MDVSEANPVDIIARYEAKGFTGQFSTRPDAMVLCHSCDSEEPAAQTLLEALHRFEGASDPSDQSAVVALECAACGAWGTAVLSYGPEADANDGAVLQELNDARDQSPIHS